jgi:hypothetical protein
MKSKLNALNYTTDLLKKWTVLNILIVTVHMKMKESIIKDTPNYKIYVGVMNQMLKSILV